MRSFAVIPAAGLSQRMGSPKLLLPWRGMTVIEHGLAAWRAGEVDQVVVVVRPDDLALAEVCRKSGVDVVIPPTAPPEMKISIQLGLRHIAQRYRPGIEDVWLLAPADMPRISSAVIRRLLEQHRPEQPSILVPYHGPDRGHPVLFPWCLAAAVEQLGDHEGVNALLDRHPVRQVRFTENEILQDLDTREDYARLIGEEPS